MENTVGKEKVIAKVVGKTTTVRRKKAVKGVRICPYQPPKPLDPLPSRLEDVGVGPIRVTGVTGDQLAEVPKVESTQLDHQSWEQMEEDLIVKGEMGSIIISDDEEAANGPELVAPGVSKPLDIKRPNIRKQLTGGNPVKLQPLKTGVTPLLPLPLFSGKPLEWASFKHLFEAVIHSREDFSDIYKLYYLRKHLAGPPLQRLQGFPFTGEHYEAIWKNIKDRYDEIGLEIQRLLRHWLNKEDREQNRPEERTEKCPVCQDGHDVMSCPTFIGANAKGRTDLAQKAGLCYKCFKKHSIGQCRGKNCTKCRGSHNIMLCYRLDSGVGRNSKEGHSTWDF